MSSPKIFLTGVTGYIGGDLFFVLYDAHPNYDYTLLVRNEARADTVRKAYPDAKNIHFALGSLQDADVVSAAAAAADVVIHTGNSADDEPSTKAIVDGLVKGHTSSNPGVYIHVTGTALLTWYDVHHKRFGQPPREDQVFDDWDGVARLVDTMPDDAPHRNVDKIVLAAARAHPAAVRTALVAPSTIYGRGRGPGNQFSIQVPAIAAYLLQQGFAPIAAGSGETIWNNVHIHDVSRALVALVEAALAPATRDDTAPATAVFGPHAYYILENGTHLWSDVARALADTAAAQGFISSDTSVTVQSVSLADLTKPGGMSEAGLSLGTNSGGHAVRARKLLHWTPQEASLLESIPDTLATEATRLGIKPTKK
ncbi:NAD-dependent epimerase/dehydratase [Niveomyces insectorum RCEF 264]|uniref:NAD-dependent epimerase/dehydratase n=1 Tax=Niveomyces insectorum RCEF 264 TaxID=1081102 RepID=A0A167UZM3_9HYPO|nr:NAD-dependent epimerase/dehydratase [Niveomyces insectorum RCEF 264]